MDSREAMENTAIRRRRECEACGMRFTTYERPVALGLLVRKRDGRIEPFQRSKLAGGIERSCEKRPISPEQIEAVVDDIEDLLKTRGPPEVASAEIGALVCEHLRSLDEVAYIRFASVYKDFRDAERFVQELETLKGRTR